MKLRHKYKHYIFVYLLVLPIIYRWLFTETIEDYFTVSFFYYPLFIPEILFLLLPFFYVRTSRIKNNKLILLSFLGLLFVFLGLWANGCNSIYLNFIGGTDFYLTTIIVALFPLQKTHLKIIRWPILLSLILISIEVILFSTTLSYSGLEDYNTYGQIRRISTTIGASTGTSIVIFMISSIAFYLFSGKKYIQLLILVFSTTSILFSLSRGAIITQSLFIIYYMIINLKLNKVFFKYLIFITSFILIGNLINKKYQILDSVNYRLVDAIESSDFSAGRLDRFDKSYSLFLQSPIFGNGSSYLVAYNRAMDIKDYKVESLNSYSPHNFFLLVLVDYGLLGLLIIGLILFHFVKISFQNKKINILNFSFYLVLLIFFNVEIVFMNIEYLMPMYLMAHISKNLYCDYC